MYNIRPRSAFQRIPLADCLVAMEADHFSGHLTIQIVASCLDCDRSPAVDWIAENGNPLFDFAAAAAFADHFDIGHLDAEDAWAAKRGRGVAEIAAARDVVKRVIGILALREPERRLSPYGLSRQALMSSGGERSPAAARMH